MYFTTTKLLGSSRVSFVEKFIILCPYLRVSTIGGTFYQKTVLKFQLLNYDIHLSLLTIRYVVVMPRVYIPDELV